MLSCTTSDNNEEYTIPELTISVSDEGMSTESSPRSVTPVYTFRENDQLSLFVVNQNTLEAYNNQPAVMNFKSTFQDDNWIQSVKVGLTDDSGTVLSFYPYSADNLNPAAIPVTALATDYLYGKSSSAVSQASTKAVIKMKHIHAMVRFKFSSLSPKSITDISISQMPESGTINLSSGVFTASGTTRELTESNLKLTVPSGNEYDYTTFILPGDNIRFKFIIDGKLYFYKPTVQLQTGKVYNINLTI